MNENKLLRIISLVFVGLVCVILFASIRKFVIEDRIVLFSVGSPLIFAFLIGVVLLLCFVSTIYKEKSMFKKDAKATTDNYEDLKKVFLFSVIILSYVYTLYILGFLVGTVIYLTLTMYGLNTSKEKITNKIMKAVVVSIVTVPIFSYVFGGIFNIMLP